MAFACHETNILPGFLLQQKLSAPSGIVIGPGFDGEHVPAGHRRRESAAPPVVAVRQHRLAMPIRILIGAPKEGGGEDIMTFAKNVSPDVNGFAGNAFNRVPAAIDTREDILDAKARSGRIGGRHLPCLVARRMLHAYRRTLRSELFHWSLFWLASGKNRVKSRKFHAFAFSALSSATHEKRRT